MDFDNYYAMAIMTEHVEIRVFGGSHCTGGSALLCKDQVAAQITVDGKVVGEIPMSAIPPRARGELDALFTRYNAERVKP